MTEPKEREGKKVNKYERKAFDFIEKRKDYLFFIIVTIIGIAMRFGGKDAISGDYVAYLSGWYDEIAQKGGLAALQYQIGNYGIPYQFLIALMTYIPMDSLYMYKILSCIFDFGLAFICARMVHSLKKEDSHFSFLMVYGIVLLFPTVVINSSIWAQCDSIYVFFVVLSLYYLYNKKELLSFVFLGIALAFKLQTFFIFPFFVFYIIREKRCGCIFWGGIMCISFYVMQLPGLLMGRSFFEPLQIYFGQMGTYKSMYMNFPSFWAILGNDYENLRLMAFLMAVGVLGFGLYYFMSHNTRINTSKVFFELAAWIVWTCILFLPCMHDRYGYLLEVLLIICFFIDKKNIRYVVPVLLFAMDRYSEFIWRNGFGIKEVSVLYTLLYMAYSYKFFTSTIKEKEAMEQ